MVIAVFTNTYLPTINGVVNSIEAFRRGLTAKGHQVYVFAPATKGHEDTEGHVFRYPAFNLRRAEYPLAKPFSKAISRERWRELSVDIIHTQHPWWIANWGLDRAKRDDLPAITTIHTQYEQYAHYGHPIPPSWLRGPLRRTVRKHCQRCDLVATPGQAMSRYLEELGVTRPIEVVPNATDLEGYDTADGSAVRAEYGIGEDEFLFCYIGRVAKEKNLDTLVTAFGKVAEAMPEAKLMIVGGGPIFDQVNSFAAKQTEADRIILTGQVPYERIKEYHAAAHVFAGASLTEVQPLSLNEAMAAGNPIIGVNAGGINDMVDDGRTGLLASPDDLANGLARCMLELGQDPERRRQLGQAAQREAFRYHIPNATERLIEVYEKAIDLHKAGRKE